MWMLDVMFVMTSLAGVGQSMGVAFLMTSLVGDGLFF